MSLPIPWLGTGQAGQRTRGRSLAAERHAPSTRSSLHAVGIAPTCCYVGEGWRRNTKTAYLKAARWAPGLPSLSGLIMQIRWFIVILILALSACGENPGAQKGEKGDQGPPGPSGIIRFVDSECRQACTVACEEDERIVSSHELIREAPSLSRLITAKLPFDLSGRAFQSGSSSHASRSDHPFGYGDRLGSRLINMGWRPRTSLRDGLAETYAEYLKGSYRVQ